MKVTILPPPQEMNKFCVGYKRYKSIKYHLFSKLYMPSSQ